LLAGGWSAAIIDEGDAATERRHIANRAELVEAYPWLRASPVNEVGVGVYVAQLIASPSSGVAAADATLPEELTLKHREQEIKVKDLDVREREAEKALALAQAPWWRRLDPLVLAIVAAVVTMIGNMIVVFINNRATRRQEATGLFNALYLS
jgi:hypothetical protein